MNFDNYLHKLNSGLRLSVTEFAVNKNNDFKDIIKAQVKELEESGFIADISETQKYGEFGILHAMFYAYIQPVSKLTNKKV